MRASPNELRSLLKQAFEGCGLDQGAYESAADLVLWSEMNGLAGFELLDGAIQRCLQSPKVRMSVAEHRAQRCRVDAAGDSILMCGALLSDLVRASALESGFCVCKVSNVRDPILLAKPLAEAQQRGLFGMVYWARGNQMHLIKSAAQECIDYLSCPAGPSAEQDGLTLVYARDQHWIEQHQRDCCPSFDEMNICHSASQVKHHRQNTLSEGVEISDSLWSTLNRVAENVLVESTEQSRQGAGA